MLSSKRKYFFLLIAIIFLCYESFGKYFRNKKVLYLSLHQGTIDEIKYAFEKKRIDITIGNFFFDMYSRHGYTISYTIANRYIQSGKIKEICDKYDLIIIGDTIPLGRPFYQASPDICQTKLALQITNRFDYAVGYDMDYLGLLRDLANNENVFWLPNNDFDLFYLKYNGIHPESEKTFLIRPYGVSNVKKEDVSNKKVIIYSHFEKSFLKDRLNNNRVSNNKYRYYSSSVYGGPLTLAQHNLFIYFPYQFSTMKVFQNSNYGVFTAIPSATFFKEIINTDMPTFEFYGQIKWFINKTINSDIKSCDKPRTVYNNR